MIPLVLLQELLVLPASAPEPWSAQAGGGLPPQRRASTQMTFWGSDPSDPTAGVGREAGGGR